MNVRKIAAVAIFASIVAACGGDEPTDTTADDGATSSTVDSVATTSPSSDTTATPGAAEGIHVADTDLGPILVDADGFTLYIFTADTDGVSTCYDGCAELWPPVPAESPIGADLDASLFSSTTRDDGSEQLTVNGMPLYLYTPDTAPGDTTGQGFNGVWFVVDADGSMIEAAAGEGALVDYGY